jgi:hypothetical protein
MPSENNHQQKYSANFVSGPLSYPTPTAFAPPAVAGIARSNMPLTSSLPDGKIHSAKTGLQKLSKSTVPPSSSTVKNSVGVKASSSPGGGGNTNTNNNKSSSSTSKNSVSRGIPGNSTLEFDTPKQNQLLSQCNFADRTIWATRVLMGGNSVNGFLRATATAQRIKKQRARQNNSTKMSRAAKLGVGGVGTDATTITGIDNNIKVAAAAAPPSNNPLISGTGTGIGSGNSKNKEIFNQQEEELLKKEIMNPRTAKKLKGELEAGLTFCATVCNVLRGVLFDFDPSLSPVLPPHLNIPKIKPPPVHTFLIPSIPPNTISGQQQQQQQQQQQRLLNASGITSTGVSKIAKGSVKSKSSTTQGTRPTSVSKQTQQQKQRQQSSASQNTTSSPGDPGSSTLRRLRKTVNKTSGVSIIATEPAFVNLPPEYDTISNKRTCTKKEYQYRVFQLLRYRDLKQGDYCAARLSSRDLWILAKVLKEYKTTSLTSIYTLAPLEFLTLSDARRDALFQKERVMLEDVEDQREQTYGTQVARNLVLPLARTHFEANEWATRLLKKGSRVYAMYPQTTSLYAATVIDSTTYCRGDDDIIVVQFDGEEADITGQFPSYHVSLKNLTTSNRSIINCIHLLFLLYIILTYDCKTCRFLHVS